MRDFRQIELLASHNGGLVLASDCYTFGFTREDIANLCRSGQWKRLARGCYLVNADIARPPSHADVARAVARSYGPSAVIGFRSAAEIHGIAGAPPGGVVDVILPPAGSRPRRVTDAEAARPHQIALAEGDVMTVAGIPVTTPVRTVYDLALSLGRRAAVAVIDSALNRGLIAAEDVDLAPVRLAGRRGVVKSRQFFLEADARAESPLETRVRLDCADGGVAPDQLQVDVFDSAGRLAGRADMVWVRARLVGEADGESVHGQPDALFNDRERQNRFVHAGWRILRFTWADTKRPGHIAEVVRAALARSQAAGAPRRS